LSSTSGEEPAASEAVRAEVLTVTSPVRAKMPEPLLTESITDLDGARAGKVEVDVNGLVLRRTSAVRQWQTSVEVEWRALERLGLALDLGVGRVLDGATSPAIGVRPAANWVLTHSPPLDFHLMAEVSARISHDATENVQDPGEGAPPFSGGVRFGIRHRWLTVRTFLGAGAGLRRRSKRPQSQSTVSPSARRIGARSALARRSTGLP